MRAVFIETNVIQHVFLLASIFVEAMHSFRSALYCPARDSYLSVTCVLLKKVLKLLVTTVPNAVSTVKFIKSVRCFEHQFVLFFLYLI